MGEVYSSVAGLQGIIEHIEHPFGKGLLTTDGSQYGAQTTVSATAFAEVPAAQAVYFPPNTKIREVEFGLTGEVYNASTAGTGRFKWQASDNNSDWFDLNTAVTTALTTAGSADFTLAGRAASGTNWSMTANPFYVRMVAAQSTGAANVLAKAKNSSYVKVICTPF